MIVADFRIRHGAQAGGGWARLLRQHVRQSNNQGERNGGVWHGLNLWLGLLHGLIRRKVHLRPKGHQSAQVINHHVDPFRVTAESDFVERSLTPKT